MSDYQNTTDQLSDEIVCDGIINDTLTVYNDNRIEAIGAYALYNCKALEYADFPSVFRVDAYAFEYCTSLKYIGLSLAETIGSYAFAYDSSLEEVFMPVVTSIGRYAFRNCQKLSRVNIWNPVSIDTSAFLNCSTLKKFVIYSSEMCDLTGENVFSGTPIANGTGYIYVLDHLVEDYMNATNWSLYASQIRPLSEAEG